MVRCWVLVHSDLENLQRNYKTCNLEVSSPFELRVSVPDIICLDVWVSSFLF